jgi:hypothetical protein
LGATSDKAYEEGKKKIKDFDPTFGEAIVEMRFPSKISEDALVAMQLKPDEASENFLKGTKRPLIIDVNGLLLILKNDFVFKVYKDKIIKFHK